MIAEKKKQKFLSEMAKILDKVLETEFKERMGFCLLVFPFEKHSPDGLGEIADYVSNAKRKHMIDFLRETTERLENREDIGTTIGTA
jgi:hypothetical protein